MAKKKAATEFNMSEAIRAILTENPKMSNKEVKEAILAKHPSVKINDNSFAVAYYTGRKKLFGLSGSKSKRSKKRNLVAKAAKSAVRPTASLAVLQLAAKFLGEAGSAEVAMEAIKQVQALQVK
jgi:hypothetical protein